MWMAGGKQLLLHSRPRYFHRDTPACRHVCLREEGSIVFYFTDRGASEREDEGVRTVWIV